MGKRIAFGFVVALILMLPSTAALAAPAAGHGNATPPGQARKSAGSTATQNNGQSHAKGKNKSGAHGKSLQHLPAPVSAPQGQFPADPATLASGAKWHHNKYVCSHGDSTKPCRPDPQPDHGRDCSHPHFVINQDHCLGLAPPTVTPPPVTPPGKGPKVLPLPKITRKPGTLPNTGVDAIDLSYMGLALLIAGQFLRKRARTIPR